MDEQVQESLIPEEIALKGGRKIRLSRLSCLPNWLCHLTTSGEKTIEISLGETKWSALHNLALLLRSRAKCGTEYHKKCMLARLSEVNSLGWSIDVKEAQ